MGAIDLAHAFMFVVCVVCYTILNFAGHSEPASNEAMLSLASFVAGSYIRSKT